MIAPNDAQQCYHNDDIGLASLVDHNPEEIEEDLDSNLMVNLYPVQRHNIHYYLSLLQSSS